MWGIAPIKRHSEQTQGRGGELLDFKCEMSPIGSCASTPCLQLVLKDSKTFGQCVETCWRK